MGVNIAGAAVVESRRDVAVAARRASLKRARVAAFCASTKASIRTPSIAG
jgi:hypothetical protein